MYLDEVTKKYVSKHDSARSKKNSLCFIIKPSIPFHSPPVFSMFRTSLYVNVENFEPAF